MSYQELKNDLDEIKALLKFGLDPKSITTVLIEGVEQTKIIPTLFTYFHNGRIDVLLNEVLTAYKETLSLVSSKHITQNLKIIKSDITQHLAVRLNDIETKTDAAANENIIYSNVIEKLNQGQVEFTTSEMMWFVSADLNYRLKNLSNEMIFELNQFETTNEYKANEKYLIDINKITKSYNEFNQTIFEDMAYADYLTLFDLNNTKPKNIRFIARQKTKFIYFLLEIEGMNDNIGTRFGINNLRTQNSHKPTPVFANAVSLILK